MKAAYFSMSLILRLILFSLQASICNSSYNLKLLSRIAGEYYSECSLITVTSQGSPSVISDISSLSLELASKRFGRTSLHPHYLFGLLDIDEPFSGKEDLRRHTPYCRTVVTFIPNGASFNGSKFLQLVTPREFPISLRDVDHYVFLIEDGDTQSDAAGVKSILQSEISEELRYKVLFAGEKQVFIFCLYCAHTSDNPKGPNSIVAIPIVNHSLQTNQKSVVFPEFAKNLNGHRLRVVGPTKYVSLYEMIKVPGTDRYEHKRGLFKEFFVTMQHKLNFSYHLKPCSGFGNAIPEGNTGVQFPNGTWAGCVADIYYRWGDLSLGGSPAGDRLHYVDFSTNMRYDYVQFFTHRPRVIYPWTVVFVCFDVYGWACVILSVVAGAVILYKTESFMDTSGPKLSRVFFYLYAYLVGQDLCVEPRSISSKVTYVYWLYYGIVVGAAYACSLQSLIVSPGLSMVPANMPELAGASDWECGVPLSFRNGLAETIFRKSKNSDMQQLYRETQEDKDAVECLARAATTDYACFHWQIMAEFYMGTEFIDKAGNHPFLYAKDYILFSGPTWMTRKREIWKWAFNDFFGRQFSMGVVYEASARDRRDVRKQMMEQVKQGKRKPMKSYTFEDDGPKPFTFENVQACFIVLLLGIVISVGGFIREVFPRNTKCMATCRKRFLFFF